MDRTGKLILGVSVLLLLGAPILQNKFAPKRSVSPRSDTNSSKRGTSPQPVIGSSTNVPITQTNTVPLTPSINAVPVSPSAPEKTVVLQNDFVRYTFTTHGGGIKRVELKKFPKEAGKEIAEVGMEEMNLDRGRMPLLAFQPADAQVDKGPLGKRPYNTTSAPHTIVSQTGKSVTLEVSLPSANGGSRLVRKVFTIGPQYQLDVAVSVSNDSNSTLPESDFYLVSGTAHEPLSKSRMMGMGYGTMWFNGDEEQSVGSVYFDNKPLGCMCMPGGDPRNNFQGGSGNVKWVGAYSRFFIQALIPAEQGGVVNINEFRLQALTPEEAAKHASKVTNNQMAYETALKVRVPSMVPSPYPSKTFKYTLYAGPREYDRLAQIGRERDNRFELIMDFGGWFGWVAEGLLRVMKWFHGKGLSYAMAIIAITFIIKLIFWPITARSTRAMKKMAAVNAKMMPEVKDIRERYKDDYQKMNMKMMETYKKYGVNPLSQMGGCLPMVIQLPIFFGFFTMLRTAIELRGAEFLWVNDLSSPENLFADTLGFPINIMPLLMTGTMFLQMRLQPPSPGMDPTQQAMMKYMPLMFVFFFYFASAGLCLYWTVSNVLGIVQTKMTKIEPEKDNAVEVIPPTKKRKRKT